MQTLKRIFIAVVASSLFTLSACAKEPVSDVTTAQIDASVVTDAKSKAMVEVSSGSEEVKEAANINEIKPKLRQVAVSSETLNASTTTEVTKTDSEWVKLSGPKEGAPTGTKKIPVLDELAPAEEFLNLDKYKGKVIYLDFWASWCIPCRDSFPFMQTIQEKYKDDLVVIAVNLDEEKENADKFLEKYPSDFEIVYDQFWQAGRAYGIYGLPFSFIYNRKGELVGKHGGFKDGDAINLDAALKVLIDLGE